MAKERINLDNLVNTRDLGGYTNKEGRHIKPKRLIRSAALYDASANDVKRLVEDYNLRRICDFRDKSECERQPDPTLEGVENMWLPIFEQRTGTITREEEWDSSDPIGMYVFFANMFSKRPANFEDGQFYDQFVTSTHSTDMYSKFLDVLANNEEGATLWHCSAGKDRCGIGTVYLLKALDFDDDLIREDYLLSNTYYEETSAKAWAIAKERGLGEDFKRLIYEVNGVNGAYLDRVYRLANEGFGSMDRFLEEKLGLTKEKKAKLKELYLD